MADSPPSTRSASQEANGSEITSDLVLLPIRFLLRIQRRRNNESQGSPEEELVIGIIRQNQHENQLVAGLLTSASSHSQGYNQLVIVYTWSILSIGNLHLS